MEEEKKVKIPEYKLVKKKFDFAVTVEGGFFTKEFQLDKEIIAVHAVMLTSNLDHVLYQRGEIKIEINKQEVFPEHYEGKLLLSGANVPPNDRWYFLDGIPAGQGKINIGFWDIGDVNIVPFEPYKVRLYVKCEEVSK